MTASPQSVQISLPESFMPKGKKILSLVLLHQFFKRAGNDIFFSPDSGQSTRLIEQININQYICTSQHNTPPDNKTCT